MYSQSLNPREVSEIKSPGFVLGDSVKHYSQERVVLFTVYRTAIPEPKPKAGVEIINTVAPQLLYLSVQVSS